MELYDTHMEPQIQANGVARRVLAKIDAEGVSIESVSQATDIEVDTLKNRLDCESEFTWGELLNIGGFFRVTPSFFFKDAA